MKRRCGRKGGEEEGEIRGGTEFSLFPWEQHIKRCNSVAVFDKGSVITGRPGLSRSFDVSCNGQPGSLGRSFEFSSRRREACRPSCILPFLDSTCEQYGACLRACERRRARAPVSTGTLAVSPFGIRQGYRGCSGVLVVIGVGRTDHLNTRHRNHDRALPLSF